MIKSMWLMVLIAAAAITGWADEVIYKHFEEEIRATPPARLTATVAEQDLKLRVQPNLQAAILVSLKKGAQVTIDYRTFAEQDIFGRRRYWFYCAAAGDLKGWAFGFFLDFDKTKLEQIPIIYDAELFVRPQGKAKPIDADKPPLPLMSGPGMVIKTAPLFIDADGRIKIRSLPVYTEIEYFPVFINQLNPKGLVKIKVKVTGETGYIDLKSGADFPIALDYPDMALQDRDLVPAFSKPDKTGRTDDFVSFAGPPKPNRIKSVARDSSGAYWIQLDERNNNQNYWITAEYQRLNWDNTIADRLLNNFIKTWPPESVPKSIAVFGQPDAWYIQKVNILFSEGKSARLHHLFFKGLYLLMIEPENKDQSWWLVEFFLWDNESRLNFGIEFNQPPTTLKAILPDPNKVKIDWSGISEGGEGWMYFYYANGIKLLAIQYAADLEMHWYLKAVHLDGFSEKKILLTYQDSDPDRKNFFAVKFGE